MDGMEQLLGNYSALTPSTRATGDGVQTTNNTYTRRFKKTNKREAAFVCGSGDGASWVSRLGKNALRLIDLNLITVYV